MPEEAIDLVERALVDGQWLGHPFAVHQGHMNRAMALGQHGRPVEALAACTRGVEVALAAGDAGARFVFGNENVRSWVLRGVGRLDEADDVNHRVFDSTDSVPMMEMHCAAALDLLEGRLLAGDVVGAEETTVAVNLAITLAEAGRQVVLVEGDLRRPRVTRYLGMVGGAGLTNILAGSAEVDDVLQQYGDGGLRVIAAGPTPPNPSELLASSHMFRLIDDLRGKNDFVLIDAPPLLPVADASGLAVMVDGVVLSVRYGSTRKEQLQQAATTLERVGAKTLGVILNIVPPRAELASAYGYGYGYGYDAPGGAASKA